MDGLGFSREEGDGLGGVGGLLATSHEFLLLQGFEDSFLLLEFRFEVRGLLRVCEDGSFLLALDEEIGVRYSLKTNRI